MAKNRNFDPDFDDLPELSPEELDFFANLNLSEYDPDVLESIEEQAEYYDILINEPENITEAPLFDFGDLFEPEEESAEEWGEFEIDDLIDEYFETDIEELSDIFEDIFVSPPK